MRSSRDHHRALLLVGTAMLAGFVPAVAHAQAPPPAPERSTTTQISEQVNAEQSREIEFQADRIDYDDDTQVVTASGNVKLIREPQRLRADVVTWNRKTGAVEAVGNVQLTDPNGNTLYGDKITLTDSLKDGMVENILLVLQQGGRLVARSGERKDGFIIVEDAAYSPCAVEDRRGCPKEPTWQLRAVKVTYDPNRERIYYDGARLEIFGLPVIPLPGLNHPVGLGGDSGLLVPDIRFSQANGFEYSQPYYWAIAPNRDLTVTAGLFTDVLPLASARYRALTGNGAYQITGYATASTPIPAGLTREPPGADTEFRGALDASGRFQLDPNWSVSSSIRVVTDRTFLRRYDISRDDRLRSTVEVERVGDQSYFSITGWATQTLRVNDPQGQVPIAIPVIDYRFRPKDQILGGQAEFQLNTLGITRTNGQDTQRAFASARWDLRRLTGLGQLVTLTAYARGDLYHSDENAATSTLIYRGNPGFEARGVGTAAIDMQWPFVGAAFGGTQTITPRFQIVATLPTSNLDIPNEDARAVELEDINIFSLSRFPGYDRVEDNVRFTAGVEYALRLPGFTLESSFGQSYRLSDKETILPDGTGLSDKTSDFVGRTRIRFRDFVQFTHRFRLDKDSFAVRRNEIDATVGTSRTYARIGYLRLNRDISDTIEDLNDREELRFGGRVQVAQYWSIFGSGVVDLTNAGEDDTGFADGFQPIRTRLGISYDDECLEMGLTWRRDYVSTGDAPAGNSFLFNIAFRNLGF